MGIYERQRHLVAAAVWGEPFRPDANAVALPLPLPLPLAAVVPTVTVATTPAPLDVVEAEEVKFGKLLVIIIQAPSPDPCVLHRSSMRFSVSSWIQIIITGGPWFVAVAGTAGRRRAAGGRRSAAAAVG